MPRAQDATPRIADVPVVILVGNSAPYDAAKGAQVGADANLPKPWDTQTMLEKVDRDRRQGRGREARPGRAAAPRRSPPAVRAGRASRAGRPQLPPQRRAGVQGAAALRDDHGHADDQDAAGRRADRSPPAHREDHGDGRAADGARAAATVPACAGRLGLRPPAAVDRRCRRAGSRTPLASPAIGGMNRRTDGRRVADEAFGAGRAHARKDGSSARRGRRHRAGLARSCSRCSSCRPRVVERIVWEVVPDLAEQIIRENLHELSAKRVGAERRLDLRRRAW